MRSEVKSGVRLRRYAITVTAVIVGLLVVGRITGILVNWLWFSSIGYGGVFWTILCARALLFAAVFAVSACAIWLSGILAHRYARRVDVLRAQSVDRSGPTEVAVELSELIAPHVPWRSSIACAAVVLGLVIAASEVSSWDLALRFIYQVPVGERDPIFDRDIGFYLFSLPAYVALKNWLLQLIFWSAIVAGAVYGVRGDIALERPPRTLSAAPSLMVRHCSVCSLR